MGAARQPRRRTALVDRNLRRCHSPVTRRRHSVFPPAGSYFHRRDVIMTTPVITVAHLSKRFVIARNRRADARQKLEETIRAPWRKRDSSVESDLWALD